MATVSPDMLIAIDGLPGGNKTALRNGLAAALSLPNLAPTAEDVRVSNAASSRDPSAIALANILFHATPHPVEGVRKWSPAHVDAYFGLLFESTSPSDGAVAARRVRAQVGWTENVRVLVDITPQQSLEAGAFSLTEADLAELKEAESTPPPPHCTQIVVHGPATDKTVREVMQQLSAPTIDPVHFL